MKTNEIKILKDYDFMRALFLYTHENHLERITEAWLDADKSTMDDYDYSKEFVDICENIIKLGDEK